MIKIGRDYSLNSPSICIDNGDSLEFISFFNTDGQVWKREKPLKKFHYHNILDNIIRLVPYSRSTDKTNYQTEQTSKMRDAAYMATLITDTIRECANGYDIVVSIEGFAYASKGAAFIDLILYNSFLRRELLSAFGFDQLVVVAPTEAKKLAGKGNADKEYMIKAFIENRLGDNLLADNPLYKYVVENELDYNNIKPIDDLIDSYWIMRCIK